MTIKRARTPNILREKVVSFQRIIFLHLVPESDLAWIVTVKDKTNRSIVFLYYVFNCIKALNVMALGIETCIFVVGSNLGLEIRKEQIIIKVSYS